MTTYETILVIATLLAMAFAAGCHFTDWQRERESRQRREALEERFRREAADCWRKKYPEGDYYNWSDPGEQEFMRECGITAEDVRRAMEDLRE